MALKKVKKKLITQGEAARELGLTVRQVQRLLKAVEERGDKAVVRGLRGRPSKRRIKEGTRERALRILRQDVYRGFGPTLAGEYLAKRHKIVASRETVRQWMRAEGPWKARKQRQEEVHLFRPRRSRCGEMVQWDTSNHDWLEGRGERFYWIAMIDDATSRMYARFVPGDSTAANMGVLRGYVETYGRPLSFYTDQASLFQTAVKTKRDQQRAGKDRAELAPTQIGRALREMDILWIGAHSPQAKGRVERGFATAQDRLVKGLRVAWAKTMEEANRYLETEFLPWWNTELTVEAANPDDAHRKLEAGHDLDAILSHVETRQVNGDYTLQFQACRYQIERASIRSGLRNAAVRVERRLEETVAVRFGQNYLVVAPIADRVAVSAPAATAAPRPRKTPRRATSSWMKDFSLRGGPTTEEAIAISNATR